MAIRMSGMISGLDTESIVKSLMETQQAKKTKIESKKQKLEWKQEIWSGLNTKMYSFYKDYAGKDIVLMIILKGSVVFSADLMRYLNVNVSLDFMQVSSYGSSSVSGELKILKDGQIDVNGKNVIIAEDIIDSGNTLSALVKLLKKRGANVEICTLLSKPARRETQVDVKYEGFEIPDEFVVGYGMDYDERFRNLPYIGILKREVYGD